MYIGVVDSSQRFAPSTSHRLLLLTGVSFAPSTSQITLADMCHSFDPSTSQITLADMCHSFDPSTSRRLLLLTGVTVLTLAHHLDYSC